MSIFKLTKKDQEWSREMASLTCREALNSAYVQLLDSHPAAEHVSKEALEKIQDFSNFKLSVAHTTSMGASSLLAELSLEPLLFNTQATLKLKFLLSNFQKCVLLGVRTLFSDQLSAETAYLNCSEFLNTVLNVVGEGNLATAATSKTDLNFKTTTTQITTASVATPSPAFLTGQTVAELYQETTLFVCSRNKGGSDAVENADEAEEIVILTKEYARHTLVLLVSLGLAADQLSATAIFKLALDLVAEIVLAKRLDFDRECEGRHRNKNDSLVATSSSGDSSSEDEESDSSTDTDIEKKG